MTMIQKKDLIDAVASESGLTPKQAERALEALGTFGQGALALGMELKLPGLGKLVPATRAARPGRNPRTGEAVAIPASTTVRFAPGSGLKAAVNPPPKPTPSF